MQRVKSIALMAMMVLSLGACKKNNEPEVIDPIKKDRFRLYTNEVFHGAFYFEDKNEVENKIFTDVGAYNKMALVTLVSDKESWTRVYIDVDVLNEEDGSKLRRVRYYFGLIKEFKRLSPANGGEWVDIDISNVSVTKPGYPLLQAIAGRWHVIKDQEWEILELRREGSPLEQNMQYMTLRWKGSERDFPYDESKSADDSKRWDKDRL